MSPDRQFTAAALLDEGTRTVTLQATDAAGNGASSALTVTLDTTAPPPPLAGRLRRSFPAAGQFTISGTPGSVEDGAGVRLTHQTSSTHGMSVAEGDGAFSLTLADTATDTITVTAVDALSHESAPAPLADAVAPVLSMAAIGDKTAPLGQPLIFTLNATAGADDPLRYRLAPGTLPTGMRFDAHTGQFEYTPIIGQSGAIALTFTAYIERETVSETVTVTVPPVDTDAPTRFSGRVLDAESFADGELPPVVGAVDPSRRGREKCRRYTVRRCGEP